MIKVSDRDIGNISASILSASDVINKKIDSLSVKLNNLMSLLIEKNNDLGKMLVEVDRLKGETKEICEDAADFTGTQTCPGYSYGGLIDKIKEIERELDGIDTDITIEDYCTGGYQDHIDNPDQGPGCTEFGVCNVYSIDGCDSYCQGYGEYCSDGFDCAYETEIDCPFKTTTVTTDCSNVFTGGGVYCEVNYFETDDGGHTCKGRFDDGYTGDGATCESNYSDGGLNCPSGFRVLPDGTSCYDGYTFFGDDGTLESCNPYDLNHCTEYGSGYTSDTFDWENPPPGTEMCGSYSKTDDGGSLCISKYADGSGGLPCMSSYEETGDGEKACGHFGENWDVTVDGEGHVQGCEVFDNGETGCIGYQHLPGNGAQCAESFGSPELTCINGFYTDGGPGGNICNRYTDGEGNHCDSFTTGGSCDRCYNSKYTYTDGSGNKVEVETKGDGTTTTTTTDSGGNTTTKTESVCPGFTGSQEIKDQMDACGQGFADACMTLFGMINGQ